MRAGWWVVPAVFLPVLGFAAACQQGGGGEAKNKTEVPAGAVTPG
jgi:hypothetical protein